jgi:hypothetical protein
MGYYKLLLTIKLPIKQISKMISIANFATQEEVGFDEPEQMEE